MMGTEITFTDPSLGMVIGCRESDGAAVVVTVREGSAAMKGGARAGMVVTRVNGERMGDFDAIIRIVGTTVSRPMTIGFDEGELPRRKPTQRADAGRASPERATPERATPERATPQRATPPPPPPRWGTPVATPRGEEETVSQGAVAERWAALRAEHQMHSERRLTQ
ncbi:hypothetical protein CTAYLR_005924, partial [Chrysophaeum taylorii]